MAEDLSGSAPKCTITPEDLDAATASIFEGHIGLEFTETTGDRVRAKVAISPALRQAAGVVHGGVYCSIVESVASWGGLLSLHGAGHVVGVNNNTDFLEGSATTRCSRSRMRSRTGQASQRLLRSGLR
ncbi:MAG: 1,4-dihydroxy-2-naphthoyl-CoA hydrolase [Mycobacterium sp.]|jgi:1,4-dihydroxy-2-naphthoyl-CoA hydrolase|nr:esterase [Mycobacterium sp.]MDT5133491.1 1,4-dihydroxy-2-naphthoyl-CoA hydrolase [Mycobacterium sp.]